MNLPRSAFCQYDRMYSSILLLSGTHVNFWLNLVNLMWIQSTSTDIFQNFYNFSLFSAVNAEQTWRMNSTLCIESYECLIPKRNTLQNETWNDWTIYELNEQIMNLHLTALVPTASISWHVRLLKRKNQKQQQWKRI